LAFNPAVAFSIQPPPKATQFAALIWAIEGFSGKSTIKHNLSVIVRDSQAVSVFSQEHHPFRRINSEHWKKRRSPQLGYQFQPHKRRVTAPKPARPLKTSCISSETALQIYAGSLTRNKPSHKVPVQPGFAGLPRNRINRTHNIARCPNNREDRPAGSWGHRFPVSSSQSTATANWAPEGHRYLRSLGNLPVKTNWAK